MALELSTTEANSSLEVTSPKTSTKISSASENLVWQTNSASRASVFPYIFYRIASTAAIKHKTKDPSPPTASSSKLLQPTTRSTPILCPTISVWYKTSSAKSYAKITTKRSSKMKTSRRSSASPNLACRLLAKSRRLASVRSENSSKQPRRSASWKKTRNSLRPLASSSFKCRSREKTATSRRKSMGTSMALCSAQRA